MAIRSDPHPHPPTPPLRKGRPATEAPGPSEVDESYPIGALNFGDEPQEPANSSTSAQHDEETSSVISYSCAHCHVQERTLRKRLLVCLQCGVNRYCCRDCQVADWKYHQKTCLPKSKRKSIPRIPDSHIPESLLSSPSTAETTRSSIETSEAKKQATVVVLAPLGSQPGTTVGVTFQGISYHLEVPPGVSAGQQFLAQLPLLMTEEKTPNRESAASVESLLPPAATRDQTYIIDVSGVSAGSNSANVKVTLKRSPDRKCIHLISKKFGYSSQSSDNEDITASPPLLNDDSSVYSPAAPDSDLSIIRMGGSSQQEFFFPAEDGNDHKVLICAKGADGHAGEEGSLKNESTKTSTKTGAEACADASAGASGGGGGGNASCDGCAGQNGGDGGTVIIEVSEESLLSFIQEVDVQGGKGGLGGHGVEHGKNGENGENGRNGQCSFVLSSSSPPSCLSSNNRATDNPEFNRRLSKKKKWISMKKLESWVLGKPPISCQENHNISAAAVVTSGLDDDLMANIATIMAEEIETHYATAEPPPPDSALSFADEVVLEDVLHKENPDEEDNSGGALPSLPIAKKVPPPLPPRPPRQGQSVKKIEKDYTQTVVADNDVVRAAAEEDDDDDDDEEDGDEEEDDDDGDGEFQYTSTFFVDV